MDAGPGRGLWGNATHRSHLSGNELGGGCVDVELVKNVLAKWFAFSFVQEFEGMIEIAGSLSPLIPHSYLFFSIPSLIIEKKIALMSFQVFISTYCKKLETPISKFFSNLSPHSLILPLINASLLLLKNCVPVYNAT